MADKKICKSKAGASTDWRTAGLLREAPITEDPRERILTCGPVALSEAELVAVILACGRAAAGCLDAARDLLATAEGLPGLLSAGSSELQCRGLSEPRAAVLMAAVELHRRLSVAELPARRPVQRPGEMARYLAVRHYSPDQEVMGAVFLDIRNRIMSTAVLFRGTLSRAPVCPRPILKRALLEGAGGVVLFHTHPSGDPEPSHEDLQFTRRIAEAGKVLGVRLLDHLILGGTSRWVSLRERGAW